MPDRNHLMVKDDDRQQISNLKLSLYIQPVVNTLAVTKT